MSNSPVCGLLFWIVILPWGFLTSAAAKGRSVAEAGCAGWLEASLFSEFSATAGWFSVEATVSLFGRAFSTGSEEVNWALVSEDVGIWLAPGVTASGAGAALSMLDRLVSVTVGVAAVLAWSSTAWLTATLSAVWLGVSWSAWTAPLPRKARPVAIAIDTAPRLHLRMLKRVNFSARDAIIRLFFIIGFSFCKKVKSKLHFLQTS